MRAATHGTATLLAIAGTLGILTATGGAAGLPGEDLAPDPVEETVEEIEQAVGLETPLTGDGAMPDPMLGDRSSAPPERLGRPTADPVADPPAPRDGPTATPPGEDRHLGHRPAPQRADPAPDGSSPRPPVWLPATAGVLLVAAAMYHRLGRDDLLDNEIRASILEAVEDDPGGTVTEYAEDVDVDRTTARYHLRMLERFDYVLSDRILGRTRYFENHGRWDAFARQAIAHLRNRSTRRLVEAILEDPGRRCRELADPTGLSESAVYRKIGRLHEIGLVEVEGRPKRVRPSSGDAERVDRLVQVAGRG